MERFWNLIHYFVYKAIYKFYSFFIHRNPILFMYKTSFIKRRFAKMGIEDPVEALDKSFKRKDNGICITFAGGLMNGLVIVLLFGFVFLFSEIVTKTNLRSIHYIGIFCLSLLLNHFLLFKKKKYLVYFKKFDKMNEKEKLKWAWISFIFILGSFSFYIGSFALVTYLYH